MKLPLIIIGIVLIAVGLVSLAYQGITYTSRERVVDLGPIKATADRQKTIPLPPILGAVQTTAVTASTRVRNTYPRSLSRGARALSVPQLRTLVQEVEP